MLTSIEQIERHATTPVQSAGGPVARGGQRIGSIGAAWYFSANAGKPGDSGLDGRLQTEGFTSPMMRPWLDALPKVGRTLPGFERIVYHMPYGAQLGHEMPFEAQIVWNRFSRLRRSLPWFLEQTTSRTWHLATAGVYPTVYLGGMSNRPYWQPGNLHWSQFCDALASCVDGLWNPATGSPLCRLGCDTWGVRGHASMEDTAAQILWRAGFEIEIEPRPAVWTMWASRARCASLTTDQLWKVTGDGGTGHGGDWAVPLTQLSGPTGILLIDERTTIEEMAGWMAGGVDLYFPAWAWCAETPEAAAILERVERVQSRAEEIAGVSAAVAADITSEGGE